MVSSKYHDEPFSSFMGRIKQSLHKVYREPGLEHGIEIKRGLPQEEWKLIMESNPFRVSIPKEFGGRGSLPHEYMALLEAASYESLPLSLMFGINMGLFLQPLAKYADPAIQQGIFQRFIENQSLGGLMITEPDFGSDALNMQTFYTEESDHFHLKGRKHWAGLTGIADFWILTARKKSDDGHLMRDIDFFVCDVSEQDQKITVEEYYDNLGLYHIPYGRNHIDVRLPKLQRLQPHSTGVKMMLDLLHRSRMMVPGMASGFIQRMLDEGLEHTSQRRIGGKRLYDFDQVQKRLAGLQASYTICSAMCLNTSKKAGIENDLSMAGIEANAVKTVTTDLMQQAAQSLTQLIGAKAYRQSHIAGRGITDSRPFQIFEGSNDILYAQISEGVVKQMRKIKETNLFQWLKTNALTHRSADRVKEYFSFNLDPNLPQRKLVDLGKAIARIISMDYVQELADHGFRSDMIAGGMSLLQQEINQIMSTFKSKPGLILVEDYKENSSWIRFM
jgi:alkylation response protein AidB-like acyl-CoA dehydrogenase